MAWYHIVGIAVVAWFGLSVLLAGAWSRFASRRTAREQQILASKAQHPAGTGRTKI